MKNETALGHVLTLMTIIIWGTTFVSTKVLLEAFTPIEILFFRFTLGYLSLWAIYPRKGTYGTLRQELLFAAANPTKKRFRSGSPSSSQFARNAVKNGAIEMMTPTLDANV